mgnify:CR=1 FL=1
MESLALEGFRNLRDARYELDPHVTVVLGGNGAGKTSLLEALYFLGRARSFRTHRLDRMVRWGASTARVVGRHRGERIGAERRAGATRLRLNGADAPARSAIAERLPVQVVNAEHQRLLLDGPRVRRQFLDWGTFHVEPRYRQAAARYDHALRQRNAALRTGDRRAEAAWRPLLAAYAEEVDRHRADFVARLEPLWRELSQRWSGVSELSLAYHRGGGRERPWRDLLDEAWERDREHGVTGQGPHRADLHFSVARVPARDALSRGQQKLVVLALLIAEVRLWRALGHTPLLLIDDLAAELDPRHLAGVLETVTADPVQLVLTSISRASLPEALAGGRWYCAQDGALAPMV